MPILLEECQNFRCHRGWGRGGLGGWVEGMVVSAELEIETLQSGTPSGVLRSAGGDVDGLIGTAGLVLG